VNKIPLSASMGLPFDGVLLGCPRDGRRPRSACAGTPCRVSLFEVEFEAAKREIARQGQTVAALQQRLFGSKSERYHPDQEELDFGEEVLGMGAQRT